MSNLRILKHDKVANRIDGILNPRLCPKLLGEGMEKAKIANMMENMQYNSNIRKTNEDKQE